MQRKFGGEGDAASHGYLEKYINIKLHGFSTKPHAKWGICVLSTQKIVEHEL